MVDEQSGLSKAADAYGKAINAIEQNLHDPSLASNPEIQAQLITTTQTMEKAIEAIDTQDSMAKINDAQKQVQDAIGKLQAAIAKFGANPPAELTRALQTAQSYANISDVGSVTAAVDAAYAGQQSASAGEGEAFYASAMSGITETVAGIGSFFGGPSVGHAVHTGMEKITGLFSGNPEIAQLGTKLGKALSDGHDNHPISIGHVHEEHLATAAMPPGSFKTSDKKIIQKFQSAGTSVA